MQTLSDGIKALRIYKDASMFVDVLASGERFGRTPELGIATQALDFLRHRMRLLQSMGCVPPPELLKGIDYFRATVERLHR